MILGIGTDMIRVERIRRGFERTPGLEERIFAEEERAYCRGMAHPEVHFAARFAAKEAVMKALGTGWSGGVRFQDIVILREPEGRPVVEIREPTRRLIPGIERMKIHVSITHDGEWAMATAVAEVVELSNESSGAIEQDTAAES